MNKISGHRKGFSPTIKPIDLDSAAANNDLYAKFTDPTFLDSNFKNLIKLSPINLGEFISKKINQKYLNKLDSLRKEKYNSLWYESGWIQNYRKTGLRIKFGSRTFFPTGQLPYSTINEQGYCLNRVLTANFEDNRGIPYGKPDEYPDDLFSGQKFRICGYSSLNDPITKPFISPYKNIYELIDHSGYQIGSVGRNFYTRKDLQKLGFSQEKADYYVQGAESGTQTGTAITYNKIYLQDNIPNIDWCIKNRCTFVYTNIIGQRNSQFDNPYSTNKNDLVKYRIFAFSGSTSWLPTGSSPKASSLGYGPYFQPQNTGLYKLYNNNFNINQSGTLNDEEIYDFAIFNTGDIPKNFYLSSQNSLIDIVDQNYKETSFYYPDNTNLSGQLVKYYTVGKNSSITVHYKNNYLTSGRNTFTTLPNGTKLYTNTGALILNEVTGTILIKNKLNFLASKKYIKSTLSIISNNNRLLADDYFYFAKKGNNFLPMQKTGSNINYDINGKILINNSPIDTKIFGLTLYATGKNIESERSNLKLKFQSGIYSHPTYQAQTNIKISSSGNGLEYLNSDRQYFKYNQGFSGLFSGQNDSIISTKNTFNPMTGAVQLDILLKVNMDSLPIFNSADTKQHYISVNFTSGATYTGYKFYDTTANLEKNLSELIVKKGYTYNLLQTNLTEIRPLAVKGDISGMKVTTPNFNKISGNYRLLQFSVANKQMSKIQYFSVSKNPVTGKFFITGENLIQSFSNPILRTKVLYPSMVSAERSGAKFYYSFSNEKYPQLYLENNITYKLVVSTGYTGFYFYTGNSIYGSGLNPYVGTAISYSEPSGSLRQSGFNISGGLYPVTGYKKPSIRIYTISASQIPTNLYYGDKYSAYAGNKINRIDTSNNFQNKFKYYVSPIISGSIDILTSDENKERISLKYNLVQDTGSLRALIS
jgi:hypothetical protein